MKNEKEALIWNNNIAEKAWVFFFQIKPLKLEL